MKSFESLPDEQWVDLVLDNYVGSKKYAVSSHGRVVCYSSLLNNGRLIAAPKNGKVGDFKITDGNIKFRFRVHKLVAQYFLPKPSEDFTYVLHLDGNAANNHYTNIIFANYYMYRKHLSGHSVIDIKPVKLFNGEQWKTIETDLEGRKHAISNFGRFISYSNSIQDGIFIKGSLHQQGYKIWRFKLKSGQAKHKLFHRMVADYFLEKPSQNHSFVIHIDNIRTNNMADNLKWVTLAEQQAHANLSEAVIKRKENFAKQSQINGRSSKLTVGKVKLLKKILSEPNNPTRKKILAKQFGISTMQLSRIKSGENWGWVKDEA
jgi:hypothetical protein